MKKTLSVISVSLFATVCLTQCKKADNDNKLFDAKFYTTEQTGKLTLYIDNVYKGDLPYFAQAPVCGAVYSDGARPLTAQLPSGEYMITGKNEQGVVVSYSKIKISAKKMSASGNLGGLKLDNSGDCLAIGVFD